MSSWIQKRFSLIFLWRLHGGSFMPPGKKAASESGQWRCTPSWRPCADDSRTAGSQTVSAESRGVTWRGGQQLERGAWETLAESRLHCSLYPLYDPGQSAFLLLQSLYFSQHFFFAMKPSIFENFEKLIQWTPIISSPVFVLLIIFSYHISLVNTYSCQDWAEENIECIIKFQVADSFSVWACPMQRLENSNWSGCLVVYLAALPPRTQ